MHSQNSTAARAEMNKLRRGEHVSFVAAKADPEQGLAGVKLALKVLTEYSAKDKAHEAEPVQEVVESDFTKSLAEA